LKSGKISILREVTPFLRSCHKYGLLLPPACPAHPGWRPSPGRTRTAFSSGWCCPSGCGGTCPGLLPI